ncbi:MAG: VCBS repeat-containing protein, partial [Gammaproteobacteria bacterium]
MKTDKNSPESDRVDDLETEQDDAIIAVALRWSLRIVLVVAAISVLAVWLFRDRDEIERVEEATLKAPASLPGSSTPTIPDLPFVDVTGTAGIGFVHRNGATGDRLLPETMGGGVAFSDLDADGDPDLLFVNSRSWPWSGGADESATTRLYLNDGEGRFTDASEGSGLDVSLYGMGVALGDADGDGLPDVFITAVGGNRLYRNLGAGRFRDVSAEAGVSGADDGWSTSAAFLDYDRDGDLDLFVTNYV